MGTSVDFAITRYRVNGSLDPTSSGDGRKVTDFAGHHDEIGDLAIDGRGRIVAGGMACEFPGNSDEVCRIVAARDTQADVGLTRYLGS